MVSDTAWASAIAEPSSLTSRPVETTLENNEGGQEQGPSVEGLNVPSKAALEVSSIIKKKPNQAKKALGPRKEVWELRNWQIHALMKLKNKLKLRIK